MSIPLLFLGVCGWGWCYERAVFSGEGTWRGRVTIWPLPADLPGRPHSFCGGSRKMAVFLKAPFFLEDIHFALVSLSFAHEKIHHCVYKCQIAMQIGICVPNYPFCVFAKRMCRQILQVWVGRPRGNLAPTESAPNKVMCPDSVWKEKAKRL